MFYELKVTEISELLYRIEADSKAEAIEQIPMYDPILAETIERINPKEEDVKEVNEEEQDRI
jgi:ribosomal protein S16